MPQKGFMNTFQTPQNLFEAPQRSMKKKKKKKKNWCHFLFQLIILGSYEMKGLIKLFLLGFSYLRNIKLAFTNMSVRHNLASVIQKWLRFKGVTKVRLTYTS